MITMETGNLLLVRKIEAANIMVAIDLALASAELGWSGPVESLLIERSTICPAT
jgi:hypothetical protein